MSLVWNGYCVFRSLLQISDQGYWVGGEKEGFAAVGSFQSGKKGDWRGLRDRGAAPCLPVHSVSLSLCNHGWGNRWTGILPYPVSLIFVYRALSDFS